MCEAAGFLVFFVMVQLSLSPNFRFRLCYFSTNKCRQSILEKFLIILLFCNKVICKGNSLLGLNKWLQLEEDTRYLELGLRFHRCKLAQERDILIVSYCSSARVAVCFQWLVSLFCWVFIPYPREHPLSRDFVNFELPCVLFPHRLLDNGISEAEECEQTSQEHSYSLVHHTAFSGIRFQVDIFKSQINKMVSKICTIPPYIHIKQGWNGGLCRSVAGGRCHNTQCKQPLPFAFGAFGAAIAICRQAPGFIQCPKLICPGSDLSITKVWS